MRYLAKPSKDIHPICLIVDEGSNFYKRRQFIDMVDKSDNFPFLGITINLKTTRKWSTLLV